MERFYTAPEHKLRFQPGPKWDLSMVFTLHTLTMSTHAVTLYVAKCMYSGCNAWVGHCYDVRRLVAMLGRYPHFARLYDLSVAQTERYDVVQEKERVSWHE